MSWATDYRPRRLNDLVGQRQVAIPLAALLVQYFAGERKLPAGFLFQGPRGLGKTTTARILAAALNCRQRNEFEPCGSCTDCRGVWLSNSYSVLELDSASNGSVDSIRDLRNRAYDSHPGDYRIFILDEAHEITNAGFNALLKILEEPPDGVLFILATTDPQRIIDTVLSRLMRFDFRRVSDSVIAKHLRGIADKERVKVTDEALLEIAQYAEGGIRDAIMLLEQLSYRGSITSDIVKDVTGTLARSSAVEILNAVVHRNISGGLALVRDAYNRVVDAQAVLDGIATVLRDIILIHNGVSDVEVSGDLDKTLTEAQALTLLDILWDTKGKLRYANLRNLQVLEMAYIILCRVTQPRQVSSNVRQAVVASPIPEPVSNGTKALSAKDIKALMEEDS